METNSELASHPRARVLRLPRFTRVCGPPIGMKIGESARVLSSKRGTVKVVRTLDEVRPFPSLIWDARFEPTCVAPPPSGKGVARDGV